MSHTYGTKELRKRLKVQVKATLAEGVELRLRRKACGRAGDQDGANDARNEQVEDHRPRARALYLADAVLFREPDLGNEATAFATAAGPLDLPLLGGSLAKAKRKWHKRALRRARVFAAVARPLAIDRPSSPTSYDC